MLLMPDPNTAVIDPFRQHKTLTIICFVQRPGHRRVLHPRPAQHRPEGRGLPEVAPASPTPPTSGPRPSSSSSTTSASTRTSTRRYYYVDSDRGRRGTPAATRGPNLGYKPRYKEGYFPVPPTDHYQDLRTEMILDAWSASASRSRCSTTRSAPPARPRSTCASTRCCAMADKLMLYKYVVKNVAAAARQDGDVHAQAALRGQRLGHARATSRCGRAASRCSSTRPATPGCPTWPAGTSAACSSTRRRSCAFANPTTNSYKRLVPGLRGAGQPGVLASATARRASASRCTRQSPKAKRLEFRCPDPSCNPYLAFSAMLMAGLDGIQNKIEPPRRRSTRTSTTCRRRSWRRCRRCRARSTRRSTRSRPTTSSCKAGDVFTDDLIETWIAYKREQRGRRHPPPPAPVRVPPLLRHLSAYLGKRAVSRRP